MQTADEEIVLAALQEYEGRIAEILDCLGQNSPIRADEKKRLQGLLKTLKEDIAAACKRKKVRDDHIPQTEAERRFFFPALDKAKRNFSIAINSDPIRDNWLGGLMRIRQDIRFLSTQLEERL